MRVVAGEFRRRKLLANPGETTRPITDRAKVKLFDKLGDFIRGRRVGDFFAGTGSLGIEALSRGAARAVLAEQDHSAFGVLRENIESLELGERALCWRVDALRSSFKPKGDPPWFPYGLVFFDPPYEMTQKIRPGQPIFAALERLASPEVIEPDCLLILRTPREADLHLPDRWTTSHVIEVSSMAMHFLKCGES